MTSKTLCSHPGGNWCSFSLRGIRLTPLEPNTYIWMRNNTEKPVTINAVGIKLFFLYTEPDEKIFRIVSIIKGEMRTAANTRSMIVIMGLLLGSIKRPAKLLEFNETRLYPRK